VDSLVTPIQSSTQTTPASFDAVSLTIANPYIAKATSTPYVSYVGTSTALTLKFKCNHALAANDKVIVTLPYWTFGNGAPTQQGCGTGVTFTMTANSPNTADARITFKVGPGNTIATNAACTITTSQAGATVATVAQPANLATRKITAEIAAVVNNPAELAIPISTATGEVLSLGATSMSISTNLIHQYMNTPSPVSFGFKANFPIANCDTITATIPGLIFTSSRRSSVSTSSCGTTVFTAKLSGSATDDAVVVFAAHGATLLADTACTLTIASGISTGPAQAANDESRTMSFQSRRGGIYGAQAGNNFPGANSVAATAITTSTGVIDPNDPNYRASSSSNTGLIIAASVIGGLVGLCFIGVMIYFLNYSRWAEKRGDAKEEDDLLDTV